MKNLVINNFLGLDDFYDLKNLVMGNNFPYHFQSTVETKDSKDDKFYFTHILYEDKINSPYFYKFKSILDVLKPKHLIRMKINCYTRTEKLEEHKPHTDYPYENKGCVLSFNSCDGYTCFEDGTKVDSIENRAVIFDAHKSHNSTSCTNAQARFNININYN